MSRRHDVAVAVCGLIAALVFNSATGLAATLPASANLATYRGADRDTLILAGAKREGKVVFYSGMIENQALRPMADAFKKKYPFMAVEYWRGDSRALVQKALPKGGPPA